ncbi:unnamed protein product [Pedinophyceae sp. YPF-701]|nr:unnamed protein product [Pedinophyceae sp. YPF-701]
MAMATFALVIAGLFAAGASAAALALAYQHLRYYAEPDFQRHIIRIVLIVPIYAVTSFINLFLGDASVYLMTIRDCYEAFIIYEFLTLCLEYVGGPGAVVVKCEGQVIQPSLLHCTCCVSEMPVDGRFVRRCKQYTLQFVLVKPVLAALTLVLFETGHWEEGNWSPASGFVWLQIVYNVSYTTALWALALFYAGTREVLAPFRPLLKFVVVKFVVFMTFWQGFLFAVMVQAGTLSSQDQAADLQDFLVCLEMAAAAVGLWYAFPHHEYKTVAEAGEARSLGQNIGHAISFRDVVSDTVHQFAPQYHDYVLYSEGQKRFHRTKTFVPVGHTGDLLSGDQPRTGAAGSSKARGAAAALSPAQLYDIPEGGGHPHGGFSGFEAGAGHVHGMDGIGVEWAGQGKVSGIRVHETPDRTAAPRARGPDGEGPSHSPPPPPRPRAEGREQVEAERDLEDGGAHGAGASEGRKAPNGDIALSHEGRL